LVLATLLVFSVLGPLVARHGPLESDFALGMSPAGGPAPPSLTFLLGTDRLYRDELARLASGGRLSIFIALSATTIAVLVGTCVGVASGWTEGSGARVPWTVLVAGPLGIIAWGLGQTAVGAAIVGVAIAATVAWRPSGPVIDIDGWLMRIVDVLLAVPFLLIVMALGAAFDRTSACTVLLMLGLTGWLGIARVLRAKTMQVRNLDYVEAAQALGQSSWGILFRHVLPNIAGPLIVSATVLAAQMVVADSALGYLGVGVSPPTPTWGRMLLEGQDDLSTAPWLVAAPGCAIVLAVWGFNILGEGLRDALDASES
jgi:ABC-type dipeptide/oligopeptide/nickel transport system permease subunit